MIIKSENKRNPVISFVSEMTGEVFHKVLCIGDPHLGRVFKTGVPSNRAGEREKSLYQTFFNLMNPKDPLIKDVIVMGDLFDRFIVSPTVVLSAYSLIRSAHESNPNIRYTIIPGNHDLSKDVTKKSSYEVLYNMLMPYCLGNEHLKILLNNPMYDFVEDPTDASFSILSYDCYNPFPEHRWSFADKSADVWDEADHVLSFGHWDSLDILETGFTPSQELLDRCTLTVSGHEHSYREYVYPFDKNNNKVLFTGSMQPYSHAEDPDHLLYVTIDQDDLTDYDLSTLKYKCVRIYCDNTFALETPIDCLSLSYLYKESIQEDIETVEDLSVVDNSYRARMANMMTSIESETKYEQNLLEIFNEKGYVNVSN